MSLKRSGRIFSASCLSLSCFCNLSLEKFCFEISGKSLGTDRCQFNRNSGRIIFCGDADIRNFVIKFPEKERKCFSDFIR